MSKRSAHPGSTTVLNEAQAREFVERMGVHFDRLGLPATSGRILGHLLICDPPVQSSSELAKALETTAGSISTNTRSLEQLGFIERAPVRRRGLFFRVAPDAWEKMMVAQQEQVRGFLDILEFGEDLMTGADEALKARLQAAIDVHRFYMAELPGLLARWRAALSGAGR